MDEAERQAVTASIAARWATGDWRAGADLLHADAIVSWQEPPDELVVCRGAAEVAMRLASFLEQWSEFRYEPRAFTALEGQRVLVEGTQVNIGQASGARIERTNWVVFRFDGDRIAEIRWNWDRSQALAQSGLVTGASPVDIVGLVQPLIEGWQAGDFRPRPELLAEDLVLTGFTGTGVDRAEGSHAIAAYLRDFFAEWQDYRITVERVRAVDDQHVLIEGRQHGVGRSSGVTIDETLFVIVRVVDGVVQAIHWHAYRDGASSAAGLDLEAGSF